MGTVFPVGGDPFEFAAGCIALATLDRGHGAGGISQQWVAVTPSNPPATPLVRAPAMEFGRRTSVRCATRARTRFLACIKLSVVRLHILWSI